MTALFGVLVFPAEDDEPADSAEGKLASQWSSLWPARGACLTVMSGGVTLSPPQLADCFVDAQSYHGRTSNVTSWWVGACSVRSIALCGKGGGMIKLLSRRSTSDASLSISSWRELF